MNNFKNSPVGNILYNLSPNTPIYRIFSLRRFVELLINSKNTLQRPNKWEDPFENFLLSCQLKLNDGTILKFNDQHEKWYGQCWTTQKECDGLWRAYSNNKCTHAVRVKTTVSKLFNSFYNQQNQFAKMSFYIGKVQYFGSREINKILEDEYTAKGITDNTNVFQAKSLLIKRKEFKYEHEVRLLYCDNLNNKHTPESYRYKIEPNNLFDSIMFDPWIPTNQRDSFKEYIRNLNFSKRILFSDLYEPAKSEILRYPY